MKCVFYPYCDYQGKTVTSIINHIRLKHKVRRSKSYCSRDQGNGSFNTIEIDNDQKGEFSPEKKATVLNKGNEKNE